jgi:hypothetical protein
MTPRLSLTAKLYDDIPSFWKNLTSWSQGSYNQWWQQIANELMNYNARYENGFIYFETEEDMTMFLLRWS